MSSATGRDYSNYSALGLAFADGIMTVTLSNPKRKNAVTPKMSEELTRIWDDLSLDRAVRVIIVTGDGNDFCSGADISAFSELTSNDGEGSPTHPSTRDARKHVMGILDCEKPVLAKVRGIAYGMGVNLALACDMVFAAPGARFCDSHVKIGLVAGDGGVLLWPLAIGFHRAKQYLLTGDPIPAELASEIGLINNCLPEAELDGFVENMAGKLRDLPPHAVNYTKMSLNVALKQMTASAFETSLAYEIYSMGMQDCKEAGQAFMEKRKGKFRGL